MKLDWEVIAYSEDPTEDPIKPCDSKRNAIILAKRLARAGYKAIEIHAHNGAEIVDGTIQYF